MRIVFCLILSCALVLPAFAAGPLFISDQAPDEARDMTAETARVYAGGSAALTPATEAAPAAIVSRFLTDNRLGAPTVDSLVSTSGNASAVGQKATQLRFEQRVGGLTVWGAYAKAYFNERGELVHLIDQLAPVTSFGVRPAQVAPADALKVALELHHPDFPRDLAEADSFDNTVGFDGKGGDYYRGPRVTRMAVPTVAGELVEGYLVETWTGSDNMLHHTLVGGNGRVLHIELRTNTDSYNIFPEHPGATSQTVTSGPGAGNTESPAGWLSGSQTTVSISGNNVHAYLDADANNSPDSGGSTVTNGNFLTSANLSQQPETTANKAVAVQNLFYFNNLIHDKLYRHGFVESAGNFQNNNFGNGGNGGDAVNAEAQDGSGTNNANFSTPSDGSSGRMQMYVWTLTSPRRDGDVDSDIIYHEYGHGLTWRMIGSMSGTMSGAIGEGMSDVLAILINGDDVVGEYSTNDPFGIRSESYTNYSRTYGDFSGSSVHFNGEIYAATIWHLQEVFNRESISQDTLFDYIIGGMNFTPAGPAMEDMRDGILQAAAGSGDECFIWEAFANRGIGVGASGNSSGSSINESFAVPASCGGSCTITEPTETSCGDGIDNDCDGLIDLADSDCVVSCQPAGTSCSSKSDCCSNRCRGRRGNKVCR